MATSFEVLQNLRHATKFVKFTYREKVISPVSEEELNLLKILQIRGGADLSLTKKELEDKMACTGKCVGKLSKRAAKHGLVKVELDSKDYVIRTTMTDKGKAALDARMAQYEAVSDELLATLSADEKAQLDAICTKICKHAREDMNINLAAIKALKMKHELAKEQAGRPKVEAAAKHPHTHGAAVIINVFAGEHPHPHGMMEHGEIKAPKVGKKH
jgi:hypothetical protein